MEIKGNLNQNGLVDQLPFSYSLCLQKGKAVAALRRFWLTVDWQQGYIGSRQDALCFFSGPWLKGLKFVFNFPSEEFP